METLLKENINWVGFIDWNIRDFHSYITPRGATYNSYLIQDEKTALIDAVKAPFADNLLRNIKGLTEFEKVDFVVCNHAEPDHSGGLPRVMETLPNAKLVCTEKCLKVLERQYDTSGWLTHIVKDGDSLSLGKHTLTFIETPLLHWPESMFTYVPEAKLLFSMDAFGQHYATSNRFDDEVDLSTVMEEAKIYYANILTPFGRRVAATLEKAKTLDIEMIAPSHGLIWRSHIGTILDAYHDWATCKPEPKVLVIYDTQWDSTGLMARAIIDGASQPGVEAILLHIRQSSLTRIATEVLDSAAVAIGSSNLNQGMMPMAGALLTYLKGLNPVGKAGFAFGSYGWGKGAPEAIDQWLRDMKWDVLRDPIKVKFRPNPEDLAMCREAGELLAKKAIEIHESSVSRID